MSRLTARLLLEKGADREDYYNDYYVNKAPTEKAKAQLRALLA